MILTLKIAAALAVAGTGYLETLKYRDGDCISPTLRGERYFEWKYAVVEEPIRIIEPPPSGSRATRFYKLRIPEQGNKESFVGFGFINEHTWKVDSKHCNTRF